MGTRDGSSLENHLRTHLVNLIGLIAITVPAADAADTHAHSVVTAVAANAMDDTIPATTSTDSNTTANTTGNITTTSTV